MTAYPIGVVGRVSKPTPTDFWTNPLSAFKSNGIPTEIDTQELQYSTKKRPPWVKESYIDIARGQIPATLTDTTIAIHLHKDKTTIALNLGLEMDQTLLRHKLIVQAL
jgi:hypothetical protein